MEEHRTVVDSEGRRETTVTHQEAQDSSRSGKLGVTQPSLTSLGTDMPIYWYFPLSCSVCQCLAFFLRSSLGKIFSSGWPLFHPGFVPRTLVSVPVALWTFVSLQVLSTPFLLPIVNKFSFLCHPKGLECMKQLIELLPVCHSSNLTNKAFIYAKGLGLDFCQGSRPIQGFQKMLAYNFILCVYTRDGMHT